MLVAAVAVVFVPAVLAFESHATSVTARIGSAVTVSPCALEVDPCDDSPATFDVALSELFRDQERVFGVVYRVILEPDSAEEPAGDAWGSLELVCERDPAEDDPLGDGLNYATLGLEGDSADTWHVSFSPRSPTAPTAAADLWDSEVGSGSSVPSATAEASTSATPETEATAEEHFGGRRGSEPLEIHIRVEVVEYLVADEWTWSDER